MLFKLYSILVIVLIVSVLCETIEICKKDENAIKCENRQCAQSCEKSRCKNPRAICICDGACGLVCVSKDLQCGKLTPPKFGSVDISRGRKFNRTAYYSCDRGYDLVGPQSRTCRSDGRWTEDNPYCMPYEFTCKSPTFQLKYAHIVSIEKQKYNLDEEVTYQCIGDINQEVKSTCEIEDGETYWTQIDLICPPIPCDVPTPIEDGYYTETDFSVGQKVTYRCITGHYMVDETKNTIECLDGAVWSNEPPECKIRTCPIPKQIENGKVKHDTPIIYLKDVVYTCNQGFMLEGDEERMCDMKGKLSGKDPKCVEIDCGEPQPLQNGKILYLEGTKWNQMVEYSCNEYTTAVGQMDATCQLQLYPKWSSTPLCLRHCAVPSVENAYFMFKNKRVTAGTYIPHNESVPLFCDNVDDLYYEYEELHALKISTYKCVNGNWDSDNNLKCEVNQVTTAPTPTSCSIPNLSYGEIQYMSKTVKPGDSVPDLGRILVYCNVGNIKSHTCKNGKWDSVINCSNDETTPPSVGSCSIPVLASSDSYILYQGKKVVPPHWIPNSGTIQLICDPHFDSYFSYYDGVPIKCVNGKWNKKIDCAAEEVSSPTITQVEITTHPSTTCRVPQLDHNFIILYKNEKIQPGYFVPNFERIELFCNPKEDEYYDYTNGGIIYECIDGNWDSEIRCDSVDKLGCKIPKLNTKYEHKFYVGANIVLPEEFIKDSQVLDLVCMKRPGGTEVLQFTYNYKCENGKWDKIVTCEPAFGQKCQLPKLNGDYYYNHEEINVTHGDYIPHLDLVALYCESNSYYINGKKKEQPLYFKCLNGKWSDQIKCNPDPKSRLDCEIPEVDKNNAHSYNIFKGWSKMKTGDSIGHLELVQLICDYGNFDQNGENGKIIADPNIYECYNGIWDGKMQCKPPNRKPVKEDPNSIKCKLPNLVENHYFKYKDETINSDKLIPHLGRVALNCTHYYQYDYYSNPNENESSQLLYFKCINGTWSEKIKCEPEISKRKQCKIPHTVPKTSLIVYGSNKLRPGESILHLERILLICLYDHNGRQRSLQVYECYNGEWDRSIMCTTLPSVITTTPTPTLITTTAKTTDSCTIPVVESNNAYFSYNLRPVVSGQVVTNFGFIEFLCNPPLGDINIHATTTYQCVNGKWDKEITCNSLIPKPTPTNGGRIVITCQLPKLQGNNYYIYKARNVTHKQLIPNLGRVVLYCASDSNYVYFSCENGQWSDEIKCKRENLLDCQITEIDKNKAFSHNVFNGFKNLKIFDTVGHLERVELICDYGDFGEIGDQINTIAIPEIYECFNGTWNAEMQCKPPDETPQTISGNGTKCKVPNLPEIHYFKFDGKIINSRKLISHLGRVELYCTEEYDYYDYQNDKNDAIRPLYFKCFNGTWSDEIACKPELSKRQQCQLPQSIGYNGTIIHRSNKVKLGEYIPHLERIVLICKYDEFGQRRSILSMYECSNGKWDRAIMCRSPINGNCLIPIVRPDKSYFIYENSQVVFGHSVPSSGHIQLICIRSFDNYYYGLIFTCINGKWNKEITCGSSTTPNITIPRTLGKCKLPTLDGNSYYIHEKIKMIPGNNIENLGRVALYCESNSYHETPIYFKCINGNWSDEIKCKLRPRLRKDCKIPEINKNNALSYKIFSGLTEIKPGYSIDHLELIELICYYGDFGAIGDQIETIAPSDYYECFNGTWDDVIQCKPPKENPRLVPGKDNINSSSCKLPNTKTSPDYFYKYEETYIDENNVTFIPHLRRIGLYCASAPPLYFKCNNGTWSDRITCNPDYSKRKECKIPHDVTNSELILHGSNKIQPGASIQHLERIVLTCKFNDYDGRKRTVSLYECHNGKWDRKIECRKPDTTVTNPTKPIDEIVITYQINNGPIIIFNETIIKVPVEAKLSLRCWGYSRNSNFISPNWKFNIYANNFGNSKYGEIFELNIDKVQMRHVGFYSCPSSVDISRRIYVKPTVDAKCKAVSDCNLDVFANGNQVTKPRENYDHGTKLAFRCNSLEFKLIGSQSVVCMNGVWSSEWPKCVNQPLIKPILPVNK